MVGAGETVGQLQVKGLTVARCRRADSFELDMRLQDIDLHEGMRLSARRGGLLIIDQQASHADIRWRTTGDVDGPAGGGTCSRAVGGKRRPETAFGHTLQTVSDVSHGTIMSPNQPCGSWAARIYGNIQTNGAAAKVRICGSKLGMGECFKPCGESLWTATSANQRVTRCSAAASASCEGMVSVGGKRSCWEAEGEGLLSPQVQAGSVVILGELPCVFIPCDAKGAVCLLSLGVLNIDLRRSNGMSR